MRKTTRMSATPKSPAVESRGSLPLKKQCQGHPGSVTAAADPRRLHEAERPVFVFQEEQK